MNRYLLLIILLMSTGLSLQAMNRLANGNPPPKKGKNIGRRERSERPQDPNAQAAGPLARQSSPIVHAIAVAPMHNNNQIQPPEYTPCGAATATVLGCAILASWHILETHLATRGCN